MTQTYRVGLIGGGQLAQMLALAGRPLGIDVVCLTEHLDCPAASVALLIEGNVDEPNGLQQLVQQVDVLSFEFEHVNVSALNSLTKQINIFPNLNSLTVAQDRLLEKQCFNSLAIPTTRFCAINTPQELTTAASTLGYPCVLKTRQFGYDGKGQYLLRGVTDLAEAWRQLSGKALILEEFITFEREVSLIAVRSQDGEIRFYPLTENHHEAGILRVSRAPYTMPELQQQAEQYVYKLLEKLNYVGVLTVEFFQRGDQLIANEMAPRVHNSGHWTIEGAVISQFENHLRAVVGLPLGATDAIGYSAMLNLIGKMPELQSVLQHHQAHFHTYNKMPLPGRKLGHITVCADTPEAREQTLRKMAVNLEENVAFMATR